MFNPWVRKIPWRRAWQLTLVFLPGEFHGQRSLAGYSPWGHKESDMTERLPLLLFSTNLSPTPLKKFPIFGIILVQISFTGGEL